MAMRSVRLAETEKEKLFAVSALTALMEQYQPQMQAAE
jgi:hypothetical protein